MKRSVGEVWDGYFVAECGAVATACDCDGVGGERHFGGGGLILRLENGLVAKGF